MKKLCVAAVVLVLSVLATIGTAIPASAATTFVDKLDDYYSYIADKSEGWQIEKNTEILSELNDDPMFYSKNGKSGAKAKDTIWLTYHMTGDITAFKIHTYNAAGLGDPAKDMKIEVSSDGKTWTEVATNVSDFTYDTDLYINSDKAYWFQYDTTNKNAIPAGNSYLKISLLAFTATGAPPWATILHSVSITHNGTTTPTTRPNGATTTTAAATTTAAGGGPATTAGRSDTTTAAPGPATGSDGTQDETTESTGTADASAPTDTDAPDASAGSGSAVLTTAASGTSAQNTSGGGDGGLPTGMIVLIVIGGVVVLGGGGAAVFFLRKRAGRAD